VARRRRPEHQLDGAAPLAMSPSRSQSGTPDAELPVRAGRRQRRRASPGVDAAPPPATAPLIILVTRSTIIDNLIEVRTEVPGEDINGRAVRLRREPAVKSRPPPEGAGRPRHPRRAIPGSMPMRWRSRRGLQTGQRRRDHRERTATFLARGPLRRRGSPIARPHLHPRLQRGRSIAGLFPPPSLGGAGLTPLR